MSADFIFSVFSEKDWDVIREESLRTGEPMQFIALRLLDKQTTINRFK